jgi:uncharacterized lipoprotein YajG
VKKTLLAAAALMLLTGCADPAETVEPAAPATPVPGLIRMPDDSVVSTVCDNGNRLYLTVPYDSTGTKLVVIPADPTCKAGG